MIALVAKWAFDSLRQREELRSEAEDERSEAETLLTTEREDATRLQKRSEMARQLHDSVLQTLKLISSASDDRSRGMSPNYLLQIDDTAAANSELESLTEKEREVMILIARGFKYRETAEELDMSIKTLETHMKHIFDKLGVASRYELNRLAFEPGFVEPGETD